MILSSLQRYSILGIFGFSSLASSTAIAQVIPDTTLPNNSIVTPQGNVITIDGGSQAEGNLFHSFEQFSVLESNTAFFNNDLDIQNIFSRVTGGAISNIEGIIETNGTANLFLINPAGIVFGSNASLNIGGSFISSTANSIIFTDGTEFSAVNPEAEPLLTINMPLGLGFGDNPEPVVNQSLVGLSVPVGETLALIGGDILIEGGTITAPEGRVELGSVAGNQTVSLTEVKSGWQFGYENVQAFQDITLSDLAFVNTSGGLAEGEALRGRGGAIQIQGRSIDLTGDSFIFSRTLGLETGETITIVATDSIFMSGDLTGIQTDSFGTGAAGDIEVTTQNLTIQDGAFIGVFGQEESPTGNLIIKASELIDLAGTTSDGAFNSGLFVSVANNPDTEASTLSINTKNLIMRDGASVSTNNFGGNQPINLRVNASESIKLLGASADGSFLSGLFASIGEAATGDGGNITIDTKQLTLTNGARILSETFGNGDAGNINITSTELVQLIGIEPNTNESGGIFAQTRSRAEGNGGNLFINTEQLLAQEGAQIAVSTFSMGNAGILKVQASEFVQLEGRNTDGNRPSGLFAQAEAESTGNAGELIVETPRLSVLDGAQISTFTASEGQGGDVILNVTDSILLSGSGNDPRGDAFGSSSILVSAELGATEAAGTLNLTTRELIVEKGAKISADNFGTGTGSNTTLNVDRLIIQEGGQIGAGSLLGEGATNSERGEGGELTVNAAESIEVNGTGMIGTTLVDSSLFTRSEGTGKRANAGNLNITTPKLTVAESGNINVSATGTGAAGNLNITAQDITLNRGSLTAETKAGNQGNILIEQADILSLSNNSNISARAFNEANGGNVNINAEFIIAFPNQNNDIIASAEQGDGGNIDIFTNTIFGIEERNSAPPNNTNDIDASSEFGLDGTVDINQLDVNPTQGLEELPSEVVDVTRLIAQNLCQQDEGSEFILTGKGGLAPSPSQTRSSNLSEVNLVEPTPFLEEENEQKPETNQAKKIENVAEAIAEARGWIVNEKGNVELVAYKTDINGSLAQPQNKGICPQ